jgi:type IV secretion system protein VirB11
MTTTAEGHPVNVVRHPTTRKDRLLEMLATSLGGDIGTYLTDEAVEEIRVNPDGRLWAVRHGERINTGVVLDANDRMAVINIVADAVGETVNAKNPSFPAEMPDTGFRFHGVIPPQSPDGPTFVIRKKASRIFDLVEYVERGTMTEAQRAAIIAAVHHHDNILVAGGTASGKTTLTNAILKEIGQCTGRVLTIEDTLELVVHADEVIRMRTVRSADDVRRSMTHLVRDSLRLTPDRIIVGEVRGPEVIDMLDGWNTGHPGGIATIHANSASEALERIEDLLVQGGYQPVPRKIARAINLIVAIGFDVVDGPEGKRTVRRIRDVLRVTGVKATPTGHEYQFTSAV